MGRLTETLILRRTSIYAHPANPTDRLPLTYGNLRGGSPSSSPGEQGVIPAVEIQTWNGSSQVFCFADHATLFDEMPVDVFANDVKLSSGFTVNQLNDNFEGHGVVSTITFTSDRTGQQISVRCRGKAYEPPPGVFTPGGAGIQIENPVLVIADLLINVHRISAAEWHQAVNAQAYMDCEGLEYFVGGVVLDDGLPLNLANDILRPYGAAFIDGDGKLRIYIETVPTAPTPDEVYEEAEIDTFRAERQTRTIVNDLHLRYAFNWRKQQFQSLQQQFDGEVAASDADSQLTFKKRSQNLEAPWQRFALAGPPSVGATSAAQTLVRLGRAPRWTFTLGLKGYKGLLQQPGDVVAFSHRKVPGGSAAGRPGSRRLMRVKEVRVDLEGNGVTLVGIDLEQNA